MKINSIFLYFIDSTCLLIRHKWYNIENIGVDHTERKCVMEFRNAILKEKKQIAHDSYSFKMTVPEGYSWKAGQHVMWRIPGYEVDEGDRDTRVFTIASAPEDGFLMFATKIGDLHTSFKDILLKKIEPGDTIQVAEPLGTFGFNPEKEKSLIIVGGIGITPIRSIMRHELDSHKNGHKIHMLFSEAGGDHPFGDFFREADAKLEDFSVEFVTEVDVFTGKTAEYAKANGNEAEYLIAGSPGMNAAFTKQLQELGIKDSNIVKDEFFGY